MITKWPDCPKCGKPVTSIGEKDWECADCNIEGPLWAVDETDK